MFRLICLRIHPIFSILHPTDTFVSFTSVNGSKHEVWPEYGKKFYEGDLLPNGNIPSSLYNLVFRVNTSPLSIGKMRELRDADAPHRWLGCFTSSIHLSLLVNVEPIMKSVPESELKCMFYEASGLGTH